MWILRWNDSTLNNPLEASKTAWPVAHKESIFLPEFPITTDLLQRDFQIENTIAQGAFGKVYKVSKFSDNKQYALKVLSKSQVKILYYLLMFLILNICKYNTSDLRISLIWKIWSIYHDHNIPCFSNNFIYT